MGICARLGSRWARLEHAGFAGDSALCAFYVNRALFGTYAHLGGRWQLPHATAEVDVPFKARFTEEERAKRALPNKPTCGSRAQRLPRRAHVPTIAQARRSYAPGNQAIGRRRSLS